MNQVQSNSEYFKIYNTLTWWWNVTDTSSKEMLINTSKFTET